jgi:mono/diheme cytochrome c family protein
MRHSLVRRLCLIGALAAVAPLMLAANGKRSEPSPARATPKTPSAPAEKTYEYVGTKKCRMCHTDRHESWLASAKAGSWEALKPGVNSEVKRRAGLELQKDYTTDPQCLSCHAVGFGRPGGYAIPDPRDDRSQRMAEQREGVGCEACHGPGSGYVEVMRDVTKKQRKYDPAEVRAAGRDPVKRDVCLGCHNRDAVCMMGVSGKGSPAPDQSWLEVDVTDRHGFHESFPMKFRDAKASSGQIKKRD